MIDSNLKYSLTQNLRQIVVLASMSILSAHAGDASKGKDLFKECATCHSTQAGENLIGPSLSGIFNRTSGSALGFRYSAALRKANIKWDETNLNSFIANPQEFLPANRMPYSGMAGASDRQDLIDYLKTLN